MHFFGERTTTSNLTLPEEAMRQKIRRLRLEVVVPVCRKKTTTTIKLPAELPSVEDENRLKEMLQADKFVRVIAKAMEKTRDCIRKKIARLGLEVVDEEKKNASTTTSLVMPKELPSVEAALKDLVEAKTAILLLLKSWVFLRSRRVLRFGVLG